MAALVQIGRLYYKGITNSRTQDKTRAVIAEVSQAIQFSGQELSQDPMLIARTSPEIPIVEANLGDDAADVSSFYCVGPRRYTFALDRKLAINPDTNVDLSARRKEIRHVLWVDEPDGGCTQGASVSPADLSREDPCQDIEPSNRDNCSNGREVLSEDMRLTKFEITQDGAIYNISIGIAYGDDDLLSVVDNRYVCEGNKVGLEFCAISELSTSVLKRI